MFFFGPRTGDKTCDQFIRQTRGRIKSLSRKAGRVHGKAARKTIRELVIRWQTLLTRLQTEPLLFPLLRRYFHRDLAVVENLVQSLVQLVPSTMESAVATATRERVERTLRRLLKDLKRMMEQVDRQAFGDIHDEMDVLEARFKLER